MVVHLLNEHFPVTETMGESTDEEVTQLACLKFIPKQVRPLTPAKQQERCKVGQQNQGIKIHISEYFQGLVQSSCVVGQLNHMWICHCFEDRYVALVKEIGMDKTQYEIALAKQKWISICLS
jgi:hypothetical protein